MSTHKLNLFCNTYSPEFKQWHKSTVSDHIPLLSILLPADPLYLNFVGKHIYPATTNLLLMSF